MLASNQITISVVYDGEQGPAGASAIGLGFKLNYSSFTTINAGKIYIHGFDEAGIASDCDGFIYYQEQKITVQKGVVNPNRPIDGFLFVPSTGGVVTVCTYDYQSNTFNDLSNIPIVESQHIVIGTIQNDEAEHTQTAELFPLGKSFTDLRKDLIAKLLFSSRLTGSDFQAMVENLNIQTFTYVAALTVFAQTLVANDTFTDSLTAKTAFLDFLKTTNAILENLESRDIVLKNGGIFRSETFNDDTGFQLSSTGESIFKNVSLRGTIDAVSGIFRGDIDIQDVLKVLRANTELLVWSANSYTAQTLLSRTDSKGNTLASFFGQHTNYTVLTGSTCGYRRPNSVITAPGTNSFTYDLIYESKKVTGRLVRAFYESGNYKFYHSTDNGISWTLAGTLAALQGSLGLSLSGDVSGNTASYAWVSTNDGVSVTTSVSSYMGSVLLAHGYSWYSSLGNLLWGPVSGGVQVQDKYRQSRNYPGTISYDLVLMTYHYDYTLTGSGATRLALVKSGTNVAVLQINWDEGSNQYSVEQYTVISGFFSSYAVRSERTYFYQETSTKSHIVFERTNGGFVKITDNNGGFSVSTFSASPGSASGSKYHASESGGNLVIAPYPSAAETVSLSPGSIIDKIFADSGQVYARCRTANGSSSIKTISETTFSPISVTKFLWYQYNSNLIIKLNDNPSQWALYAPSETVDIASNMTVEGLTKLYSTLDGNATGNILNFNTISATSVYGAKGNDVVDWIETPAGWQYGYAHIVKGHYYGIPSDTFSLSAGYQVLGKMPRAIAGFVLCHVDRSYAPGTPLTFKKDGSLTRWKPWSKKKPMVARFYKTCEQQTWNDVCVNGRSIVQVVF